MNASNVVHDKRPNGTTQIRSLTLNNVQFHSYDELDDDENDVNVSFQDKETDEVVTYRITKREFSRILDSLIDSGANGGLAGFEDMLLILPNGEFVNVEGIDNHTLNCIALGTFASLVKTSRGPRIFFWHQYARVLTQKQSIHSKFQLEAYGNIIRDGFLDKHMLITPCGCKVPFTRKKAYTIWR